MCLLHNRRRSQSALLSLTHIKKREGESLNCPQRFHHAATNGFRYKTDKTRHLRSAITLLKAFSVLQSKVTWLRGSFIRPWSTDLIFREPIGGAQPEGRTPPVMNAYFWSGWTSKSIKRSNTWFLPEQTPLFTTAPTEIADWSQPASQ